MTRGGVRGWGSFGRLMGWSGWGAVVVLVGVVVVVVGVWLLPGCSNGPSGSVGAGFAADAGEDASARRTLDSAVLASLGGHGWTVLSRETRADGARVYGLHSLTDEPGELIVVPLGAQPIGMSWRLDVDRLALSARMGWFPREPENVRRAEAVIESLRDRLRDLEETGYAPIPGR